MNGGGDWKERNPEYSVHSELETHKYDKALYSQLTQDLGVRVSRVKAQILCPSGIDLVTVFPISLQWKTLRYLLSSLGFGNI